MGIKERVKNLEMKAGKLPQGEMNKVMEIFGRAMAQFDGVTSSNDGKPVTGEEFDFLRNRLNRLKDT